MYPPDVYKVGRNITITDVYILIKAKSYTIIDIYPSVSNTLEENDVEILKLDNLVNRKIERVSNFHEKNDFQLDLLFLLQSGPKIHLHILLFLQVLTQMDEE